MNLSAPFINRPVMTTFVMLTIIIAGVLSFFHLPVNDLPNIEQPNINVSANYLGASPETVLNQVTIPLEKELTLVKGIQEMKSTSSAGFSQISLSFDLSKNMDEAVRDVQAALNRAEDHLPSDMTQRPTYSLDNNSQEAIMWILLTSDQASSGELRSYGDAYIVPLLSRLEGVAQVVVYGAKKSIWLRLDPELMAARQIGFNDVVDAVKAHTSQMPLGTIQTKNKKLSIELPATVQNAKDLENLKIGSGLVRLKDIAEIKEENNDKHKFHLVNANKTSLMLAMGIKKVSDGNTVAISKRVEQAVDQVKKGLPSSMQLNVWFQKAGWIEESLHDVQWTLAFAFFLVVFVIYLSLGRFSESLIASAALPMSLIGTCIIMYLAGFSLDLLSLLALTLSVGFVVDDAIVVLENIVRCQEKGLAPKEASLIGSKQIGFTILSMTVSLVAVFIPLLFMTGMNGRLFREFSVTLSVAILVSGFISLTLTPMLCSRFLSVHDAKTKLQVYVDGLHEYCTRIYGNSLRSFFKLKKSTWTFAASCLAATVFLFSSLSVNLIPPEDRGLFFPIVNLPVGISTSQVTNYQTKLEELIKPNPHIIDFLSLNFGGNLLFLIKIKPHNERPPQQMIINDMQTAFDTIPGIQTFIQPYQLINLDINFGSAGQYALVIKGIEFKDVEKATELLADKMRTDPMIPLARSSINNDSPMLAMSVNEELAHQYGFGTKQIQSLLMNAYGQGSIGSIQKGAEQEKIYMELLPHFQDHKDAPEKLYLSSKNGHFVPLKSFLQWEEKLGAPALGRRDQLPSASIRFSLAEDMDPGRGLKYVEDFAKENLPTNVVAELDGNAKAVSSTINHTLMLLLAAAIVMYVVLGILYESFIHPLTILSSIPFAGLGGVLTLFLFNEPISIFSAVGFLLLIGIVKKNGIMMVDYALEAKKKGLSAEDAIHEACLVRFRPIMMTTVAAIMGAIPIAIGFGDGAEMRRGLGLVIIGGLLFSQILTLYVTPVIFLTFEKLRKKA